MAHNVYPPSPSVLLHTGKDVGKRTIPELMILLSEREKWGPDSALAGSHLLSYRSTEVRMAGQMAAGPLLNYGGLVTLVTVWGPRGGC